MNIVFIAPLSLRRTALAAETRAAADDGHEVVLVAEGGRRWRSDRLDERVRTLWIGADQVRAAEPRAVAFALRRLPLGLVRRAGRGPLRRPAGAAGRLWKRAVVGRLDRRLKERSEAARRRHRVEAIRKCLAEVEPDHLILHEPSALELGVAFLPELLDSRPETGTAFSYEARVEAEHV